MADPTLDRAGVLALARFVSRVMAEHRNDGYPGDVDGGTLQDIAVECGLLVEVTQAGPCDPERCVCADELGDFPLVCLRDTPLLAACRAASTLPDEEGQREPA